MKILFITYRFYPYIGGIEVNSEILANEFQKAGHEIVLVTWSEDPSSKKFPYKVIRKPSLKELFKLHNWADVVYENNPSLRLSWPALVLAKRRVAAIRTWVSRIDGRMALQDYIKKFWLKSASAVIAISEKVRLQACKKAVVIGNPYRKELFKNFNTQRTKEFVFLSRLVSNKGADHAIKALQNVSHIQETLQKGKPFLTIIGDGPEMTSLQKLVQESGLTDQVVFTGALRGDDLVNCLNEHKFLLVPSLWEEPFGNVALEGMACGCIPIVSDGGGLPDAVGNAGLIFERGNIDALSDSMNSVLQDEILVSKLKSKMQAHLENHYPEIVAGRYMKVITALKK